MNIIGHKNIFFVFSGLLILGGIISMAWWGFRLGIDFTGGSLLEVEFLGSRPDLNAIQKNFSSLDIGDISLQPTEERGLFLRFKNVDERTHQEILTRLASASGQGIHEKRFDTIGPTIGRELRQRSLTAIALALIFIVFYIAWAFRQVSRPVSSWKYGLATILALVHDLTIPTGVFAFLGHFKGVEINTLFVTALLTILGFSVHDTIVVFDRIRENLRKSGGKMPFEEVVNSSINETIGRSINTSFTVLLVLFSILTLGGQTTFYFALLLILGIFFGTYSSIFIASPILVVWHKLRGQPY